MFGRTIITRVSNVYKRKTLTQYNLSTLTQNAILDNKVVQNLDDEWNKALPYEKMPEIGSLPFFGNKWRALPLIGYLDLNRMQDTMRQIHEDYGSCVRISGLFGDGDMIFLYDPKDIEKLIRIETDRTFFPTGNYYKYVLRKEFFSENKGVIDVKHEDWLKFRPKVQRDMLDPKVVKLYTKQLDDVANALVQKIKMKRDDYDEMENFSNDIRAWALESIGTIALDTRLGCLDPVIEAKTEKLLEAMKIFAESILTLEFNLPIWKVFNTPTWNKYVESLDIFRETITMYARKAMEQNIEEKQEDSLSLLQRLLIRNKNDPSVVITLAFDMFLVGIDTTSYSVGTLMYQLAQNQSAQEILYREISSVLQNTENKIDLNDLQKMPYLKACIKENLRLNPVLVGNVRALTENRVIQGYQVHKGTQIFFAHHTLTNSEEYFKDSAKFIPERWLHESNCSNTNKFAYLPFGFGKRMCLGKRIADLEAQIVICKLLHNYKVEYRYGKSEHITQPLLKIKEPFKLAFVDRKYLRFE